MITKIYFILHTSLIVWTASYVVARQFDLNTAIFQATLTTIFVFLSILISKTNTISEFYSSVNFHRLSVIIAVFMLSNITVFDAPYEDLSSFIPALGFALLGESFSNRFNNAVSKKWK